MELNEDIEMAVQDASAVADGESSPLMAIAQHLNHQIEDVQERLALAFQQRQPGEARKLTCRYAYLVSTRDKLKVAKLGGGGH